MDRENWRSSSKKDQKQQVIILGRSFSEHPYRRFVDPQSSPMPEMRASSSTLLRSCVSSSGSSYGSWSINFQKLWRTMRRKFRKEKRVFHDSNNGVVLSYNPYTYAQNFDDEGVVASTNPENLSRSFSARFAASSSRNIMFSRVQSVR